MSADAHHTRPDIADVVKRMEAILERVENERDTALGVIGELVAWADPWTQGKGLAPGHILQRARELVRGES